MQNSKNNFYLKLFYAFEELLCYFKNKQVIYGKRKISELLNTYTHKYRYKLFLKKKYH